MARPRTRLFPAQPGTVCERRFYRLAALPPGDRLLEIGCATGKATLPLARRGFGVTCIELGPDLARAARANLAGYDVSVVEGSFESWRPPVAARQASVVVADDLLRRPVIGYRHGRNYSRKPRQLFSHADDHGCL
jgi:SAM-dependent methyltransferase